MFSVSTMALPCQKKEFRSALLHLDFWLFIDYDNEHAVCKCMQLLLNLNLSFDVMIFGELCPFIKLFCALPCHYV